MDKKMIANVIRYPLIAMLGVGLIVEPLHLSYTQAYFTDQASPQSRYNSDGNSNAIKLGFDVHNMTGLNVTLEPSAGKLLTKMNIPFGLGFNTEDLIIDEVELSYNGTTSQHTPINMTSSGTELNMVFDWEGADNFNSNQAVLKIRIAGKGSGKGQSGLGEKFIFDGWGELVPPPPIPEPMPEPIPEPEAPEVPEAPEAEEDMVANETEDGDPEDLGDVDFEKDE